MWTNYQLMSTVRSDSRMLVNLLLHNHIQALRNIVKLGIPYFWHHEDAGWICPLTSSPASPSFLVPKANPTVLPHQVNNYQVLNPNTVLDSYPLLCVDNILADCAKGHIWSHLDMTNSCFCTHVHPDNIHLTAITPFGLHEWMVMPQGLKNVPLIHQHWMNTALHPLIGKICHIYIDDIVIWSSTIAEHVKHIDIVMKALITAHLFCNPKKCDWDGFSWASYLSSRNWAESIKISDWPVPTNLMEVWAFLGLVWYIASFLTTTHMY